MKINNVYLILLLLLVLNCKTTNKKKDTNLKNSSKEDKIELIGIIKKITAGPAGTFSQYAYFILDTDNDSNSFIKNKFKNILFNKEDKNSHGFDEYVDKKVKIIGREIIGYIGWRKDNRPGILVEKIKIIK